jgi:hypothetical protein
LRKKRRFEVEAFGMSFLDLIACAFAGVVILYVTAEPHASEEATSKARLTVIELQAADAVPAVLGLRVHTGTDTLASWQQSTESGIQWIPGSGSLSLVLQKDLGPLTVDVMVLELPPGQSGSTLPVLVRRDGIRAGETELGEHNLYRDRLELP